MHFQILCPLEAYCPNGVPTDPANDKALFLDRGPFDGEQWAPIRGLSRGDDKPDWVAIGSLGTCATLSSLGDAEKSWSGGGEPSEHTQNVLCCSKKDMTGQSEELEGVMEEMLRPIWFDAIDGWDGGTWNDAVQFCDTHGGRQLCPYSAYCPYGDGSPVMGRHRYDFEAHGEQWAPLYGITNGWVMIGQKYRNSATTCMTFEWLEGSDPPLDWGDNHLKKHLMCCSPPASG